MDKDKGCLEPNLPVTYLECCSILEVSVSGYLAWVQRQKTPTVYKSRSPEALVLGMTTGFLKKQTRDYVPGIRPILSHLQHNGVKVGKERLRRILRSNGIIGRQRRRYKTTTNSEDTKTPFENLLSRQFEPGTLNKVWTSDITYIWTTEGWAYVSTFIDLGSRRVLGACFADNMATPMVVAALESALKAARPPKGLVVHSDQGSQYNSASYRSTLEHHGLLGSMSSKGECWDNAPTESFWSIMKREICAKEGFRTRDEAFAAVQKWLTYYNEERPHSALGGLSPAAYEAGLATTRAQRRRLKLRSGLTLLKDCSETR